MLRNLLLIGAVVGIATMAALTGSAQAGKPSVQLSHQLYSFDDGSFKVDYIVQSKGGGSMDLAVSHECFSDGELIQSRTNRVYWSGKGQDKTGHWNLSVQGGAECSAVVVDLDQTSTSSGVNLSSSGYVEVSPTLSYTVE